MSLSNKYSTKRRVFQKFVVQLHLFLYYFLKLGSNFGYHISLLCCIEKIWFGLEEYVIIKVLQTTQSFLFGHKMRVLGQTLFPFILLLNTFSSLYSLMLGSALRILFFRDFERCWSTIRKIDKIWYYKKFLVILICRDKLILIVFGIFFKGLKHCRIMELINKQNLN